MKKVEIIALSAVAAAVAAQGGILDRERGIKIGERMTLRPYLSMSYTYDSNIDSSKHSKSGSQWVANPGLELDYLGENFKIDGSVWYQYHAYNRYVSQLNSSSYGERLRFDWADSRPDEAGWRVLFSERFEQIAQDDDMSNHNGRGVGRDRKQFSADGAVERRLNERIHIAANANYYLLDYDNDVKKYGTLYGWKRLLAGGEAGYMASRWTDILVAANYQWYWQDNDSDRDYYRGEASRRGKRIRSDSKGWTVMGGIGTRATEKLSYKLLAGWSRFEYGSGTKDIDGWTYQVSGDWQIDAENTMHLMLLGSSYYQPSEYEYGSAMKVYNLSLGFGKGFIRNKLRATADVCYRHETHEYVEYKEDDYNSDIWTGRVGLSYTVNRFVNVFGRIEYQTRMCDGGGSGHNYDYDRWRGTVGFTLTY